MRTQWEHHHGRTVSWRITPFLASNPCHLLNCSARRVNQVQVVAMAGAMANERGSCGKVDKHAQPCTSRNQQHAESAPPSSRHHMRSRWRASCPAARGVWPRCWQERSTCAHARPWQTSRYYAAATLTSISDYGDAQSSHHKRSSYSVQKVNETLISPVATFQARRPRALPAAQPLK